MDLGTHPHTILSVLLKKDDLISEMDEYWADDGEVHEWRLNMRIGTSI